MIPRKHGFLGNPVVLIMMIVVVLVLIIFAGFAFAKNGNGFRNLFYDDVVSGTEVADGCKPKKYVAQLHGSLDLINDYVGFSGWEMTYIDTHIDDISWQQLGIFSDEFDSKICLYDVLANGDNPEMIDCVSIDGKVRKGDIKTFPFSFRYNLYDNDCNGEVDDHTFNLVAEVSSDDGFERAEKTVAIVNGQAVFQNVKY
ncbi:hypothetical protein D1BOALGB6SA_4979 [Olavius sp. associated proteobacterium Delta 1]|nr:hypothetical protein D1BOALGB6SA_4979 [Olavius sp. associated proteobacterium Delta 1]